MARDLILFKIGDQPTENGKVDGEPCQVINDEEWESRHVYN